MWKSLYRVCLSHCLETVLNPGQVSIAFLCAILIFVLKAYYFDLRLVKNVMCAPPKPVWPEWIVQKLGLRQLKRLDMISAKPILLTCTMNGSEVQDDLGWIQTCTWILFHAKAFMFYEKSIQICFKYIHLPLCINLLMGIVSSFGFKIVISKHDEYWQGESSPEMESHISHRSDWLTFQQP